MTDYAAYAAPDRGEPARTIQLIDKPGFDGWLAAQPEPVRTVVTAQKFTGAPHEQAFVPGPVGAAAPADWTMVCGVANAAALSPWCLARLPEALPPGRYRLAGCAAASPLDAAPARLGWLLGHYRFDRYRTETPDSGGRILLTHAIADLPRVVAEAAATHLVRDLVNTPALDMGADALEAAAADIARAGGAALAVTRGAELAQAYPMIHAVGMAATRERAPRLIEMHWGDPAHPRIAIIGKGVMFDTGGLNLKPGAGMRMMKKDMGGAAHALALAQMIMALRLPVRLHLLIPVAENSISGAALRPGDVLRARSGASVEIDNTDAEGRLILADALTRAAEDAPGLMLDFATLTGAARVALGPDLPALFANDDALAADLVGAGRAGDDPLWQMPLWDGYREMLASDIADIANSGGAFGGAITAALFLKHFVPDTIPWAHIDTFSWRAAGRPGRPKGGDALGLRAAYAMLEQRYRG